MVLPATSELEHFYRVTLEPEQFAGEIQRLRGLWPDFNLHFAQAGCSPAHQSASCLAGTWPGLGRRRDFRRRALEVGPILVEG